MAGPVGGLLFAAAAGLPFLANAGTYAASALLVAWIAGSYRPERGAAHAGGRCERCWCRWQGPADARAPVRTG